MRSRLSFAADPIRVRRQIGEDHDGAGGDIAIGGSDLEETTLAPVSLLGPLALHYPPPDRIFNDFLSISSPTCASSGIVAASASQ